MSHRSGDGFPERDPNAAIYRPVVFADDYKAIGEAYKETPVPGPFEAQALEQRDYAADGEQRFIREQERREALSRQAQSGYLAEPWRYGMDGAITPQTADRIAERAEDQRAFSGGLPDAPGEAGGRFQAKLRK